MTLRGTPGPYGAPYDDGSDPRWSDDFLAIVNPHPELLENALGLLSSGWDMGARAKPGPPPKSGNPFWGLDTEAADARITHGAAAPRLTRETSVLVKIQAYAKFLVAVLGGTLTAVTQAFPDNTAVNDWGPLVLSVLTAIAVYGVPNKDPLGQHQDESTQPPGR